MSEVKTKYVRCNMCSEIYVSDEEYHTDLTLQKDNRGYFWGCPSCKTDSYLMDRFIQEETT